MRNKSEKSVESCFRNRKKNQYIEYIWIYIDYIIDLIYIRVNSVLKSIEILSKCSSKNYSYNDEQVKKMLTAIRKELNRAEILFSSGLSKKNKQFKF